MDATNRKKADPTRIGDKWARREDIKWFQYWCQFLQVSPSYELARKCRAGELTIGEPVPADFDAVLAVYDNLGSVIVPSFVDWWREIGITHFGYAGEKPKPALLGAIQHHRADDPSERLTGAVESYVSGTWHQQGEPAAIIAAIPVGLPKAQIVKWVDAMLAEHGAQQPEKPSEPTYKLYGKKLHFLSVYQYLRVTQAKAANPDMTLWQLGDLPPSEWPIDYRSLDHEGGMEWLGSTSPRRSSASCVRRRSCWRRAGRWPTPAGGSASPNRAITAGARSTAG